MGKTEQGLWRKGVKTEVDDCAMCSLHKSDKNFGCGEIGMLGNRYVNTVIFNGRKPHYTGSGYATNGQSDKIMQYRPFIHNCL